MPAWLVLRGPLDAFDDDVRDWTFLRIELETELLLDGGEDRWPGVIRRVLRGEGDAEFFGGSKALGPEFELEVVLTGQAGFIEHRAPEHIRQCVDEKADLRSHAGNFAGIPPDPAAVTLSGLQFVSLLRDRK